MVVTLDIVFEVLHIPKVALLDYHGCDRLKIMSKDEHASLFCETPSSWDECQNTLTRPLLKVRGSLTW